MNRDVYEHESFLYLYISVALFPCSDSETFSSELILTQVQYRLFLSLLRPNLSYNPRFNCL